MRNGGQPQQTAVMTPPHLNGSAQFVSGGYVGYVPRQSWGQFQGPQHPRNTARPLSHPPPPPSRRESQRPSGNGSANPKSTSLPHCKPGTHRSTTPSVSSDRILYSLQTDPSRKGEKYFSISLVSFLSLPFFGTSWKMTNRFVIFGNTCVDQAIRIFPCLIDPFLSICTLRRCNRSIL